MRDIRELLKEATARGASDLHIKVGSPPMLRLYGNLVPLSTEERVTYDDSVGVSNEVMSPAQKDLFKKKGDLDFSWSVPGLGRFRCNVFVQRGAVGLVFRLIPMKVPSIEELNLPAVLNKIALEERGLVLVTGTTGSGKSTTLAAMINAINVNRRVNIITIEDPIEYLHKDQRGVVNQREVGADTSTFSFALRASLRQDPDVILVGEMRDMETIETAMTAAETGHLVMSTLHTVDAAETVNRIISVFPPHQHEQIRIQLASILKGIISMRLIPLADGSGRVPAVEVLVATSVIRDCIRDPVKTKNIRDYIAQGRILYGMQTFDQSILDHLEAGLVTFEEAIKWTTNPDDFKLKVKGVRSTSDLSKEESGQRPDSEDMEIDRFQK
jgi:twitching motility protein PilT